MKYWRTFALALQTQMLYRANLVMWFVVGLIGPATMIIMWLTIMGQRNEVGGYSKSDFIVYYILMTVSWYVIGGMFAHMIGHSIKDGSLNRRLIMPYSMVIKAMVEEQAWKVTSLFMSSPVLALIVYVMRDQISLSVPDNQIGYIVLSIVLAAILFGLMQAIIGILAFWVTEIWPFINMFDVILNLLGGMLAPITLMPTIVQRMTVYLPFRYMFYEPIEMILGKTQYPLEIVFKQVIFVTILFVVYKVMWRAGIKRYEAIGG